MKNIKCLFCLIYLLSSFYYLNAQEEKTIIFEKGLNEAIALQKSRNPKAALPVLDNLLNTYTQAEVPDSLYALAYHKRAVSYYSIAAKGKAMAIEEWKQALEIRIGIFPEDHLSIIKTYRNIGTSYIDLNNPKNAAIYLKKSLSLHLNRIDKDSFLLAKTYRDLTIVYIDLEELDQAKKHFKDAEKMFEELYAEEPWTLAEIYTGGFEISMAQDDLEGMELYPNKIIKAYETIDADDWEDQDHWFIADAFTNLAILYYKKNQYQTSINYDQNAIEINKEYPEERVNFLLINYCNMILTYNKIKETQNALEAFEEARRSIKSNKTINILEKAIIFDNGVDILIRENLTDEALMLSNDAINLINKNTSIDLKNSKYKKDIEEIYVNQLKLLQLNLGKEKDGETKEKLNSGINEIEERLKTLRN